MRDELKDRITHRRSFLKEGAATVVVVSLGSALTGCGESTTSAPADATPLRDGGLGDGPLPAEAGPDRATEAGRDYGDDLPVDGASPAKRPATTVSQRITGVLAPTKQPTSKKNSGG